MCTVSWSFSPEGYELYCNRDEQRDRLPALPPRLQSRRGVPYVTPVDGGAGGSWIAVNEAGLSLCLLNAHDPAAAPPVRSRGLLVLDLIDALSAQEAMTRVVQTDLRPFAPFVLLAVEAGRASTLRWDGESRCFDPQPVSPLVSSSFDSVGVRQSRLQLYESLKPNLAGFHASHGAGQGPYSPCMHREDAETVSFSKVTVQGSEIEFYYQPGAPCLQAQGKRVWLSRRRVAA